MTAHIKAHQGHRSPASHPTDPFPFFFASRHRWILPGSETSSDGFLKLQNCEMVRRAASQLSVCSARPKKSWEKNFSKKVLSRLLKSLIFSNMPGQEEFMNLFSSSSSAYTLCLGVWLGHYHKSRISSSSCSEVWILFQCQQDRKKRVECFFGH